MSQEARWFVVHTYSGYENKVKEDLEKSIENLGMQDTVLEVKYPTEEAIEILPSGKIPLSRDYDGQTGVDDTAEEGRALRQQGIRVAAVFMGENAAVPAANAIYGRDLARIRRMDQLAAAAGRLIQDEIRELSG